MAARRSGRDCSDRHICLSGEWPAKLWMFAIALGFVEWMFLELKQATGRTEIGALVCCAALTVSLGNTTFKVFQLYWNAPQFWPLEQIFRFMLPIALPWTLILILLMHSARELAAKDLKSSMNPASQQKLQKTEDGNAGAFGSGISVWNCAANRLPDRGAGRAKSLPR